MAPRDPVTVILLGPPVPYARMRTSVIGRHFVPGRQRNAAAAIQLAATEVMQEGGYVMFDEPVMMTLRAEMPIPASWSKKKQQAAVRGEVLPTGKPDLDNLQKLCADSMSQIVMRDDAQVVRVEASKVYSLSPKIIVTIAPMNGELKWQTPKRLTPQKL